VYYNRTRICGRRYDGAAKKYLEQGADPLDAAMKTGFTDQSHFTKFFKKLIGLTPRQYADIFK